MKLFHKVFLLLFAGMFLTACSPRINVVKVSNSVEPNTNAGYYYALPRNYIRIDVVVNETELIKGPYAEFAEKYLGLTNVINTSSTSYEISEFKMSSVSEPDPEQYYHIELPASMCNKLHDFKMQLTESGLLMNTSAESDTVKAEKQVFSNEKEENVYPDIFKYYTDLNLFERVDTIIEKVKRDTGTIEKVTFKRSMVAKTPDQKAKDAADFIIKVKENRFNLISGFQEVNYDKETFQHMNNELEKLENEYRKLFTGISFTRKITYSFIYLPEQSKTSDTVALFKFSKLKGVLDKGNGYGETVFLKINKTGITDTLNIFVANKNKLKAKNHGLYYRIPDYADVSVFYENAESLSARFLIPQYGVICSMPAVINRYGYFPNTGAINKVGK
ncbi:MAG: DUF4831 family protein [Bacteroidota bacterium]